ncbi:MULTISPECIES: class F sortase [Streptomycetaceae]|uniref:Secreted protein n=1 Tax=Streptantibioticus cattleyicolor (strain ATCC 35852 / DSM 46488 / JCM 4925 / NBRC 14057 / NRRL 8057) TaxID=1003195 RepID=F8K4C3_STREN|nr:MULTISPECIES: class F sortase [Streptomycetaceae]AEW93881.1 secreted protein [Streptantibioticus cattleyicolor NRRL 8057 = DSM 46488]MYS58563.1 class F sortase [Streptomyces sp. SID5468]CCB74229.1 Secreted protein (modular protein) [Streptantibioticus cattleyicolor NRRL 8057 = DSM 46488]
MPPVNNAPEAPDGPSDRNGRADAAVPGPEPPRERRRRRASPVRRTLLPPPYRGRPSDGGARLALVTAGAVVVLALVFGVWLLHDGARLRRPPAPARAEAVSAGRATPKAAGNRAPAPLPYAVPTRVRIPAIGVDAPLIRLGLDARQHLQVPPPDRRNVAGWYDQGPAPGSAGASVLAGHVDTMTGPAVFYGLGALHKGDTVQVVRADRRTAVFTVYGIEVYPKAEFPTDRVYGPTPVPELRLITCGGGYAKGRGYLGNVVVYARLTRTA